MEETKHCESCGIPLTHEDVFGTNSDKSKNKEYCIYCYRNGTFTQNVTMEEMICLSLEHMKEIFKGDENFDEQAALQKMQEFFPRLKRWQNTGR